jgi:hypothetical protein
MRRAVGRAALAIALLAAAGVAVAALALGGGAGDGGTPGQEDRVATAPLKRRDLTSRQTFDGALGYAGEAPVIDRLSGTFTWLPEVGDAIRRGERLFEVDNQPVLLMYGGVPAYRDLAEGVSNGPDVRQLESNLAALGFDPGTVDDEFTWTTAAAVAEWQRSLDLKRTGEVELGRVVFLPGARRVTSLSVALGSSADAGGSGGADGSGPGSGDDTAPADDPVGSDSAALASATTEPTAAVRLAGYVADADGSDGADGGDSSGRGGAGHDPQGQDEPESDDESDPLDDSDAADAGDAGGSGEPGGSDGGGDDGASNPTTEVMATSSELRIVTLELDPADGGLVERGGAARVLLPDGTRLKGRVASVGTVAESDDSGGSSDPKIEITISLPRASRVTGLDKSPVRVELVDAVRRDVFAVPVESLLATAGGGYVITVIDGERRRQLPVRPGLFAGGYVEVEGRGLRTGMRVEVPGE